MSENESLVRSQHFAFQNIVPSVEEKIHCRKPLQKHYEISRSAFCGGCIAIINMSTSLKVAPNVKVLHFA